MVEAVAPVERVDTVALAVVAGAAARQRIERRQKRLRWLGALRQAMGEDDPETAMSDDGERDEAWMAENRERISGAIGTAAQLRRFAGIAAGEGPAGEASSPLSASPLSAADVARLMINDAGAAMRVQARLGGASVLRLLDTGVSGVSGGAVNGA